MEISRDEVLHVAKLARLELTEDEVGRFQEQLSAILEAVGKVSELDLEGVDALIDDGTASAGMVAKLRAARAALDAGVTEVAIVHGRDPKGLLEAPGTRITTEKVHAQRNG